MGAKLSKKKKGYCLGAGKDGESTETTEVEQKETETQVGQKDAAEPNGENPTTDLTLSNGSSEEKKAPAEKNGIEVPSGETTKDDLNKDQKSESKPSAEQKKVEEPNQEQDKHEPAKSSIVSEQSAEDSGKAMESEPEEKLKSDDKEKESLAKDEHTQECKSVTEQKSSDPHKLVTETSAALPDQKEVSKPVPDPETKVTVEKMEKDLSEQTTKEPTDVMKEPQNLNEKVEQIVVETVLLEAVPAPVVEVAKPEPGNKVVEPEPAEVSLPETQLVTELIKPEPDIAPEPVTESLESKVSEEPIAPVPEVVCVEPMANSEMVPCPEPEQLSETKQDVESSLKPLPSNEVPDQTNQDEDVKNDETLGNDDLVTNLVETHVATTESELAEQPSAEKMPDQDATVVKNGPSEQAAEEMQENKVQDTISTEQEVLKEMQNEVKGDESITDKPTDLESLQKDCKDTEVALDTSKNVNDQVASEDTTVHDATQDKHSEDKIENHEIPAEELSHEPSAPLIVEKHGVGNGLPLKEDVKEHLENGCDTDLHELNGQVEGHEIVCSE
ncbi:probable serine/threonine-protein kinase kinX [Dendropsophus ebraccatus]|uniref:probable serine/threonine-protein kinase kinX n=1 Tax=Dendropsophus ebraccatus TaxID=150705 RepID=UPI0038316692